MPYTVSVYIAAPGTPLNNADGTPSGKTSTPGHMYYSVSDGKTSDAYGFAPITSGSISGPGKIYRNDTDVYVNPLYTRTMEISKEQYEQLKEFGNDPARHGFDMNYRDARNNCVDFVWNGLNHAKLHHTTTQRDGTQVEHPTHEGSLKPSRNVDDVKSIKDPIPGSALNNEQENDMPANRSRLQKFLSENVQPADQGEDRPYRDIHLQSLAAMERLDSSLGRTPDEFSNRSAASMAATAMESGLNRIDHIVLSDDRNHMFAVQGELDSPTMKWTRMETMTAAHTPVDESLQRLDAVSAEQKQTQQAAAQQEHDIEIQQKQAPRQMA